MKRIYIASPLFSQAEKNFNDYLSKFLEDMGFETFLPQRDGYNLSELLSDYTSKSFALKKIFELDISEIKTSDIVVFIMDGRVPDEGACVEIGYAYALGKECIGLKTDSRALMSDLDNPLIIGTLKDRIARNFKELEDFLIPYKKSDSDIEINKSIPIQI